MNAHHIFPQCVWPVPPWWAVTGVVVTTACTGYGMGPLCSVVVTALSGAGSAPWLLEYKPPDSFLSCSVRQDGLERSCWDRGHWVFLLWSCPPGNVLCGITCHPLCGLTTYTVVGIALSPTSIVGMQAIGPRVPQVHCSHSHPHRSTGTDPLKSGTRTTVVAHMDPMGAGKQPTPQPSPASVCLHVHTRPTAAEARPLPAMGAPTVYSRAPQALSLQRQGSGVKPGIAQPQGLALGFSPAFQVAWSLEISSDFSPTSTCGQSAGACTLPELIEVAPRKRLLWWPYTSLHAPPQRCFTSMAGPGFLCIHTQLWLYHTPAPSGCLHAANHSSLLKSVLWSPSFSTQPLHVLAGMLLGLGTAVR